MGWNQGYTIFEQTVIGAYDLGILNKPLLSVLMEPYRGTDIDSGGSRDLQTHDGKDVRQVVVETWGLAMPDLPSGPARDNDAAWETYDEAVYDKFRLVTRHFDWS